MSWTDIQLKFLTENREWPGTAEKTLFLHTGLPVKPIPNLKHQARADQDYERRVYRTTDGSPVDYYLEIERIERPNDKTKHDVVVTLSHCKPDRNYDSEIMAIVENAKRLGLEQILENKKQGTSTGNSPVVG